MSAFRTFVWLKKDEDLRGGSVTSLAKVQSPFSSELRRSRKSSPTPHRSGIFENILHFKPTPKYAMTSFEL